MLSFMIISAVGSLIFLSALAVGVNDAMIRNTTGLFSGQITGFDLPGQTVRPSDLAAVGVKGVLMRVLIHGTLSHGGLEVPTNLYGIDPVMENELTAFKTKIIQGRYPRSGQPEILISGSVAELFQVRPGQSLSFTPNSGGGTLKLTVTGIYQTRLDLIDRGMVFCPLNEMPKGKDQWTAAVFLEQGIDPGKIIARYHEKWHERYRFASWQELMPDLKQLVDLEYISMGIVIVLVFIVVSMGIAGAFVIFIIKNIREYGIMKAMGVTSRELSFLIVMKVAIMSAIACTIGILAGALAVWGTVKAGGIDISAMTSHNRYFTVSGIIYPRLTCFSLWVPPATAFVFIAAAGVWPAVLTARQRAVDVIRMI